MSISFEQQLQNISSQVNRELARLLSDKEVEGEISRPPRLMAAIRHGVLNGGKRLRPFLLIETAKLFGKVGIGPLMAACALECLHCYSLIHDDLPCMDDDDLRRGQPTVHKAYDEAMAVLAGDALLTLAFDILSGPAISDDPRVRVKLVRMLARAAGQGGMIGGQVLDIAAETTLLGETEILQLQAMKTGALIRFSCEAGAILGGANDNQHKDIIRFGEVIGQAFQLADDLLDVTASSETMGKATGKDAARGKKTLIDFHGIDGSRGRLISLIGEANDALSSFGNKANSLKQSAIFIAERSN